MMASADRDQMIAALARASRYGRNFETVGGTEVPKWNLDVALTRVSRRLGTTEPRVAASSLQYEFAARLWAVALGAWAFGRVIPNFDGLRYGCAADGTLAFGFVELTGWNCRELTPESVAELLTRNIVAGQLADFHRALREQVKIADGLLWGNAAAALVLSARSASRARSCAAVAATLLASAPLADRMASPARRRSCCLFYRTRARSTCGDCPLPPRGRG